MKTILSIVSVLMLVIGAITLGTGALDVGLLLGSDGGAVAEALAGLAVVVFVVGGLLDIIGGPHRQGRRRHRLRPAGPHRRRDLRGAGLQRDQSLRLHHPPGLLPLRHRRPLRQPLSGEKGVCRA